MSPRTILLVDDQVILLDVIRRHLESDPRFAVVGEATAAAKAVELAARFDPDIVMLDVDLGRGESGFDVAATLRRSHAGCRIVMVSMFEHRMYRDRAFEVGADAYATKGIRFAELCEVLLGGTARHLSAISGRCWFRPERGARSACLTLSQRELGVLRLLASGMRDKEAAECLSISVSSIGTYLKRSMDKMGISSRTELMQMASAMGTQTLSCGSVDVGALQKHTGD